MGRNEPGWLRRHRWLTGLLVVAVLGWAGSAGADDAEQPAGAEVSKPKAVSTPSAIPEAQPKVEEPTGGQDADRNRPADGNDPLNNRATQKATQKPAPKPVPVPTALVARVIDGDTVELASGQDVRLVGIDTPEVGECGYEKAKENLRLLVEGKQVRLIRSDEDQDHYGRLLRYINIGDADAGLRLIKNGLAIARYDSRDGYGYHQREPIYIASDRSHANITCASPALAPAPKPRGGACAPGYAPCIPPYPPDVDCAGINGPIYVTGTDPHGLDADGDGVACE